MNKREGAKPPLSRYLPRLWFLTVYGSCSPIKKVKEILRRCAQNDMEPRASQSDIERLWMGLG